MKIDLSEDLIIKSKDFNMKNENALIFVRPIYFFAENNGMETKLSRA